MTRGSEAAGIGQVREVPVSRAQRVWIDRAAAELSASHNPAARRAAAELHELSVAWLEATDEEST